MVAYFNAVSILTQYVKQLDFQYNRIVIKILRSPPVNVKMLSWDTLLESDHFPPPDMPSPGVSTDEIINFLRKWSAPDEVVNDATSIDEVLQDVRALLDQDPPFDLVNSIEPILEGLQTLQGCKSPGWKTSVAMITSEVELLGGHTEQTTSQNAIHDIIRALKNLDDNSLLFRNLRKSPLATGDCEVAMHCEVVLASLISLARTVTSGPVYRKYRDG